MIGVYVPLSMYPAGDGGSIGKPGLGSACVRGYGSSSVFESPAVCSAILYGSFFSLSVFQSFSLGCQNARGQEGETKEGTGYAGNATCLLQPKR